MLRLRPLRPDDESQFRAGHDQMAAEGHAFGLRLESGMAWDDYLKLIEDHRAGLKMPGYMVSSTFLVAAVGGTIVGRTSIRHHLNDRLLREGGNIGSIRVIESCGGVLENALPRGDGAPGIRRYWID
ncbi:MAG: GNAT family N-acetyltransferase [Streptosporangiaceae bacterium]